PRLYLRSIPPRSTRRPSRAASSSSRCSSSPARAPAAARRRTSSWSPSCSDRMVIANATGCSSIYGGSAPTCPYTVNEKGHGPAWANSLFEDNAEFGFGMNLAFTQRREKLAETVKQLIAVPHCWDVIKEAGAEWLEKMNDAEGSKAAAEKLLAACKEGIDVDLTGTQWEAEWLANGKKCPCEACTLARE